MRILNILTAYNEIKFMPLKKQWCDRNGVELYVIDNMSKDGTWQWCKKNNIPSRRVDTNEAFDLRILHASIMHTVHEQRPDWVIFNGADLFPIVPDTLRTVIETSHNNGYNQIVLPWIMFYNTGEKSETFDPFNTYFYFGHERGVAMISKYSPRMKIEADEVKIPHPKQVRYPGVIANYGHTKSKAEREETYERRKRAWKLGMNKGWGIHYKPAHQRGWVWDKKKLNDIRESEYFKYIQKLQQWTSSQK